MIELRRTKGLGLILSLVATTPRRSALLVVLLLVAGIAEGVGIAAFLPLLQVSGFGESDNVLTSTIFETITATGLDASLGVILSIIAIVFVVKGLLMMAANLAMGYGSTTFATDQRAEIVKRFLRVRWEYHLTIPVGSLSNVITIDTARGASTYALSFQLIAQVVQITVYFSIAFWVSWVASIVAIAGSAVILTSMSWLVVMSRRAGEAEQKSYKRLASRLVDQLGGVKPIKAMGAEDSVEPLLLSEIGKLDRSMRQAVVSRAALTTLQEPLMVMTLCGGIFAAVGVFSFDISTILLLVLVFYRTGSRLTGMQGRYQSLVSNQSFVHETLERIREAGNQQERLHGGGTPSLDEKLELRNVAFKYGQKAVVEDVSLTVPAGKLTTLIGPSGSGKTTIVDIVIQLLIPTSGEVLIDGRSLLEMDIRKWRKMIGYVPQETALFNDTILTNVTLGDPKIDQDTAVQALKDAGAYEFVSALERGLDSTVGERGAQLSGGQRQRIALARALARKPRLLILDEPTTALDPVSEALFCETLRDLSGRLTVLAISHQVAVADIADQVYRIGNGTVMKVENRANSSTYGDRVS
ncbi:MAG: ABC transporter ATP-binding protein [Alphaproteobacteria bacterium]